MGSFASVDVVEVSVAFKAGALLCTCLVQGIACGPTQQSPQTGACDCTV